jgi:hypothetical protein
MMYDYKVAQVPPNIDVRKRDQAGNEAAIYLQTIANEQTAQGWEFYRVDTIDVKLQPGCL